MEFTRGIGGFDTCIYLGYHLKNWGGGVSIGMDSFCYTLAQVAVEATNAIPRPLAVCLFHWYQCLAA
jgi:hypothetical protein